MYFYNKFKLSKNNQIDTWDYQLVYSIWKNKGLILKPTVNLSKHIGWGKQAYHGSTHDDDLKDIKVDYPEITNSGIMLPSYPGLKEEQQEYIINCLKENLSIK